MTRTVQILAFDNMEVLDYAGPYEAFNVAGESGRDNQGDPAFVVHAVGVSSRPVGRGGFAVLPDYGLEAAPVADILIVPGGAGTRPLTRNSEVLAWVRQRAASAELLLTVCTGALVAAAAGLLDGLPATTHHLCWDELVALAPAVDVRRGPRFVQSSDRVWTSAGVSAGVDLSLEIIAQLEGQALRELVEAEMEWCWPDR